AQIDAGSITNVRIHPDDAREVIPRLGDASLSSVFVLFPDPWPKLRHHKRRFIQKATLDQISRVLKPGGPLRVPTDHMDSASWPLAQLRHDRRFRGTATRAAEWRARADDWPATRYEQKALKAGRSCVYLSFIRT